MKRLLAVIVLCCVALTAFCEFRTWTAQTGQQTEAEFVTEAGGMVALKLVNSNIVRIARSKLSAQDEAYLRKALFKPKTYNCIFEPTEFEGEILYWDADRDKSPPPEVNQGDVLCFKYLTQYDKRLCDDSSWSVLLAEDVGQTLTGNTNWVSKNQTTDGKFIRVIFKLTNNSKDEYYIDVPQLVDSKERKVSIIADGQYFIDDSQFKDPHLDKLLPGFTRTYCAIYETAKDAESFKLQVQTLQKYTHKDSYFPIGDKLITLDVIKAK